MKKDMLKAQAEQAIALRCEISEARHAWKKAIMQKLNRGQIIWLREKIVALVDELQTLRGTKRRARKAEPPTAVRRSAWVAELEAARRCIMRWEAKRDKPLTECDEHRAGKVLKLLERMIEMERCRSATDGSQRLAP